jgi:hypothetical protein
MNITTLRNLENNELGLLTVIIFMHLGALVASREETSKLIKRSVPSLKRDQAEGVGIPTCQLGKETGSDQTYYNIYDISRFIISRKKKVLS